MRNTHPGLLLALFVAGGAILLGGLALPTTSAAIPTQTTPTPQADCPVITSSQRLPLLSEQLLYSFTEEFGVDEINYRIVSTDADFEPIDTASAFVSSDGVWVAWVEEVVAPGTSLIASAAAIIREVNGQTTLSFPLEAQAYQIQWLGNTKILSIYTLPRARFFPFSIFNLETHEVSYVHPFPTLYGEYPAPSEPLLPAEHGRTGSLFSTSPDGRYFFYDRPFTLYDTVGATVLLQEQDNMPLTRNSPWSPDSSQVLYYQPAENADSGYEAGFYVFDVADRNTHLLARLEIDEADSIFLEPGAWSPDGNYLAFSHGVYQQPSPMYLLHIPSGEVIDTCLVDYPDEHTQSPPSFDFAWSHDSRYLAFTIALPSHQVFEQIIYMLDTTTMRIYEVYEGFADIVGWGVLD